MRHRIGIAGWTGLGNPDPELLDNEGKLSKLQEAMIEEAMELWKPIKYGVDYKLIGRGIKFGREPAYQYENLFIIYLAEIKEHSYIQTGKSFDSYGSGLRSRTKLYGSYKYKSKFTRFIDKWHEAFNL